MDFLKENGFPSIGAFLKGMLSIAVLGVLFLMGKYLFDHPLVLVLVLAAIGGLAYLYIRHRKKKNRV